MKEKILFFSHESKLYGAPRSMLILVDGLKEKYNVEIVTYGEGDLVIEARKKNISITVIDKYFTYLMQNKSNNKIIRAFRKLSRYAVAFSVMCLLIKRRPDLIYINTIENHWPVVLARFLKIPSIVHVRESESYIFSEDPKRDNKTKAVFSNTKNFICVSESIKELVVQRLNQDKNYNAVVYRVYNGIDCNQFRNTSCEELSINLPLEKKVVGFLGNINPRKGLDVFLKAAELLLATRKDIVFLVVGGDELGFSALMDSIGISATSREFIFHLPFIKQPQAAFEKFDIYCMTSLAEPFARVNLEAACMKVPAIATSIHGNKEIFEDGESGLLVKPGDSTELANKIHLLLDNEDVGKKLTTNAYQKVQANFTIEKYITGCDSVIEHVLKMK